ncbi:MAG: dihydrofolate reductase family protein [Bacteroidota bacterium]
MRKIFVFMNVSVDGYVEAPGHDISWAHGTDSDPFAKEQGREVDGILFGHRTYEMMRSFWPTPQAVQVAPETARFMNEKQKYVASHASFDPGWRNVTVLSGDVLERVRQLKAGPGQTIAIFGSNTLCTSLVEAGLIDEFQIMVNPVVLGEGTPLFHGLVKKAELRLTVVQSMPSGAVFLTYARRD